ncbi:hypothetical protein MRX96_036779 [Rhipicephalus microplus]
MSGCGIPSAAIEIPECGGEESASRSAPKAALGGSTIVRAAKTMRRLSKRRLDYVVASGVMSTERHPGDIQSASPGYLERHILKRRPKGHPEGNVPSGCASPGCLDLNASPGREGGSGSFLLLVLFTAFVTG